MKAVMLYEFKDLSKDVQTRVWNERITDYCENVVQVLCDDDLLTEEELDEVLGCNAFYRESTPAFVASAYYETNKEETDTNVKQTLDTMLFTKEGMFVQYNEDDDTETYRGFDVPISDEQIA